MHSPLTARADSTAAADVQSVAGLRIAAMIFTMDVSGPGRQLVALAQELQRRGATFTILLLHRTGTETTFPAFCAEAGIECRLIADRGPIDPQQLREVRAFIEAWRPDILETHGYKTSFVAAALRRGGVKVPWVGFFEGQTNKGLKDRLYHKLDLFLLRFADRAVVMSELQRRMLPARARHVRVVANAVPELARAKDKGLLPPVLRRRRGEGVPHIGAIGRLSREKGVDVFLEALAAYTRNGGEAHGVIIGEGPLEAELKAQAQALGLGDNVTFTGRVDMVREVYEGLDLMVIPSRSEGLPSVLLEALPTDLPVVSTRVGAMIEIAAAEPQSMSIVAVEQPEALAAGIAEMIRNGDAAERKAARARVAAAYSIDRRADHMSQIFDEAMAKWGLRT